MERTMLDVSFIMPTNRDPKEFADKVVQNINSIPTKYTYEILTFSPIEIQGENVKWYKEETNSDGCITGYNYLTQKANGKYLIHTVDDCYFDNNIYTTIDLLESPTFARRGLKFLCVCSDNGLGSFLPNGYPRYTVPRYPIVSKDTVNQYFNGYLYHPEFKNHYADNWLGWFITNIFDETLIEVYNTLIHIGPPTSYNHNNDHDFNVFKNLINKYMSGYRNYV